MILLVLLVIIIIFVFLYRYFTKVKHPFKKKKFIKIQSTKDNNKQIYSTKKELPKNIDVIIIGSGIGALTCGALLSLKGKRVLILEQHDVAGGSTHIFKESGYEFDTGVHYVGKFSKTTQKVMDEISQNNLKWSSLGDIYDRSIIEGEVFDWNQNREKTIENLCKKFPKEQNGIRKYFQLVFDVHAESRYLFEAKTLPNLLGLLYYYIKGGIFKKYEDKFLLGVLRDELKLSKQLIAHLCYHYGNHGIPPESCPFNLHAMVHQHFLRGGGFFPSNGCEDIARSIIPTIQGTGGNVLVKCLVKKILVKNNIAYGVLTSKNQKILAPVVISSAGVYNTFNKLLSDKVQKKNIKQITKFKKLEPSISHFIVFIGLNKSSIDLKLPKYNTWIHDSYDLDKSRDAYINKNDISKVKCSSKFIGFPSSKDEKYSKKYPNKSNAIIITECKYDWVKEFKNERIKQRSDKYNKIKKEIEKDLIKTLIKHYPQVEKHIDFVSTSTPLSTNYYLNSKNGSSYSLKYSKDNWIVKPKTFIDNLYLTGSDVCTSGFAGAISGGLITYVVVNK